MNGRLLYLLLSCTGANIMIGSLPTYQRATAHLFAVGSLLYYRVSSKRKLHDEKVWAAPALTNPLLTYLRKVRIRGVRVRIGLGAQG
jgi:hypothetical protein